MSLQGRDKPTSTTVEFQLFPDDYFTRYKAAATLSGKDSRGIRLAGTFKEKTLAKTTFMGNVAIPIQTVTEFSAFGMGFGKANIKNYYSSKVNDRRFLGVSGDITTVKAATKPIPLRAKIGDSGIIGHYTDSRNFQTTLSWALKDGLNGKAKLILLNKTYKPSGGLDNTFKTTHLIRTNGHREDVQLETYNDTVKLTVSLKGKF